MHALHCLDACLHPPSMHSRFLAQDATISGDATCSARFACRVSLLLGELCMHARHFLNARWPPLCTRVNPAESNNFRRRHLFHRHSSMRCKSVHGSIVHACMLSTVSMRADHLHALALSRAVCNDFRRRHLLLSGFMLRKSAHGLATARCVLAPSIHSRQPCREQRSSATPPAPILEHAM
jgi:hypothetical protein